MADTKRDSEFFNYPRPKSRLIRRLTLWCLLSQCGGKVDHDEHGVFWKCSTCGRVNRADWTENTNG